MYKIEQRNAMEKQGRGIKSMDYTSDQEQTYKTSHSLHYVPHNLEYLERNLVLFY